MFCFYAANEVNFILVNVRLIEYIRREVPTTLYNTKVFILHASYEIKVKKKTRETDNAYFS